MKVLYSSLYLRTFLSVVNYSQSDKSSFLYLITYQIDKYKFVLDQAILLKKKDPTITMENNSIYKLDL